MQIHVVEYNTKNRTVFSERIYKHNGQIFGLSPCPYDPQLCFVIVGCESGTSFAGRNHCNRYEEGCFGSSRKPLHFRRFGG